MGLTRRATCKRGGRNGGSGNGGRGKVYIRRCVIYRHDVLTRIFCSCFIVRPSLYFLEPIRSVASEYLALFDNALYLLWLAVYWC